MENLQKVIWAEGIFLGQQHFQQWDLYLEKQQKQLWQAQGLFNWGLLNLQVDEEALLNKQFSVRKLTAILSNGQFVHYDRMEDEGLSCIILGGVTATAIYLGVPLNQQIIGMMGYPTTNSTAKWKAEYRPVRDLYDINREREVLFGKLNLVLLTEQSPREGFHCLKIAEVVTAPNGEFELVKTFVPALLKIKASVYLQEIITRIAELSSAKIRVLNQRREQFRGEPNQFGQSDLEHFLLLQTLNRSFPLLRHYLQNLDTHPHPVYLTFLELAGALCAFSTEINAAQLPAYQHENLATTFGSLDKLLQDLLEKVMPTRINPLKLRRESEHLYLIDNIEASILNKTQFYLAVFFQSEDAQWIIQFGRQIKVGAAPAINSIVTSALPGVKVTHVQRSPTKLTIKAGYEYFYLEPIGNFWEQVKAERSLGIFLPFGFIKANLELVTVQD